MERELWVPVERLQPIVARWPGSTAWLSATDARRLHQIQAGKQAFVSLRVVDRLLLQLDLDEWLRLPREDGGLADIYEDGCQYGDPQSHLATCHEVPPAVKRRSRSATSFVPVVCPECGIERAVGRDYALYKKPGRCMACAAQASRRYATEEDRVAALRASWRLSKRRAKLRNLEIGREAA